MDDWTTGFGFGVFWLMPFLVTLFVFELINWTWVPIPGLGVFVIIFVIMHFVTRFLFKNWAVNAVSEDN